MFCSTLICTVPFFSVLFCSVPFFSVPLFSVLFHSFLFCSILFSSVLFCSVPFFSLLFNPYLSFYFLFCCVPFFSVLFCSVLFCSVLFCYVLFSSFLFRSVSAFRVCVVLLCIKLKIFSFYYVELSTAAYFADDQVNELITAVDGIRATGGWDCPEFGFDGMINALYEDPRWGSPLYVFTDAPPKDANEENKETVRVLAEDLGITVNFFAAKTSCGAAADQQPFKDVVEAYGGQYLSLDSAELSKMAKFTSSSLDGTATVGSGKSGTARRKRRATTNIGIPIDDTVTQLVVTVTTDSSPHGVQLYTPTGRVQTAGREIMSKVILFNVDNPIKGFWKLVVPSSVGKYEYSAKVISPENIDFEHYFSKRERGKWVNLRNPLAGKLNEYIKYHEVAFDLSLFSMPTHIVTAFP